MFKRRDPLPRHERLRGWIWPRPGWRRASVYVMHRLSRLPGSGYSIACGFAFGSAISFTPFVGMHLLLAGLFAWLFGGNVLAAWIGTLVGNPWTFPFIWLGLYKFGNWILRSQDAAGAPPPDFTTVFSEIWEAILSTDFQALLNGLSEVILPMTVAGIPCFVIAWVITYFPMKYLVESYKRKRIERMRRKKLKRLKIIEEARQKNPEPLS